MKIDSLRAFVRPYLAIIFPTAVVIIGGIVCWKLLPKAIQFIDRDIALVIIVTILGIVSAITIATATIMGFYFGERAGKKKEDK